MSLSFHAEHLAWQQRVHQEKNRANTFYKTQGGFFQANETSGTYNPFPKIKQTDADTNYRSFNYNLAYAFGGTRTISAARTGVALPPRQARRASLSPPKHFTANRSPRTQEYVKALKTQLQHERGYRRQLEYKLKGRS